MSNYKKGDIISEKQYYVYESFNGNRHLLTYVGGVNDKRQLLVDDNVLSSMVSPSLIKEEKKVTRTELREIFSAIGDMAFYAEFIKNPIELSKTKLEKAKKETLNKATKALEAARKGKKSIYKTAIDLVEEAINNPITDIQKGELRKFWGYKKGGIPVNGIYAVVDLIELYKGNHADRQLNVNGLSVLVYNNIKYIIK